MSLREEQQRMLHLFKNESLPDHFSLDILFLDKIRFQKRIIVWWRCFQFEHWLILTSKLLKDQGMFESLVISLYQQKNISSYPAEAGEQFVQHIHHQPLHATIKSVAAMELALIRLKDIDHAGEYRIRWNQPPFPLLDALMNGYEYSLSADGHTMYEMVVSNQISGKIFVSEIT